MLSALFNGLKIRRRPSTHSRHVARSRRPQLETMEAKCLLTTIPMMLIDSPMVDEGTHPTETTPMIFTVTLTAPTTKTVTVNFRTADSTATAGSDYIARSGKLTFSPGQTTKRISVQVIGDSVIEETEAFHVVLSGATNARIIKSLGVGSILDDDTAVDPAMSINDERIIRGRDGSKLMYFTLSLNTTVNSPVTVRATTRGVTAVAGTDFEAMTQTITFEAGETTKQVAVRIYGWPVNVGSKLFYVDLSQSNVLLGRASGAGIINDGE